MSETNEFSIVVGLHQGVTSNAYLFMIVVDELTVRLRDPSPKARMAGASCIWLPFLVDDLTNQI